MNNEELSYIFNKQKEFQSITLGKDISNLTIEERSKLVHEHMHFLVEESIESLRPLPYHKEWKDYSSWTEDDIKKAFEESQEEAVDVFIFLVNAMFLLGIESDEVVDRYNDKLQINKERQHNPDLGYVNHTKIETPEDKMDNKRYTQEERDTLRKITTDNIPQNLYISEHVLYSGKLNDFKTDDFFRVCTTKHYPGFLKVKIAVMLSQEDYIINYINNNDEYDIFLTDDFIVESNNHDVEKDISQNIASLLLENTLNSEEELNNVKYYSPCLITDIDHGEVYIVFKANVSEIELKMNDNFQPYHFDTLKRFLHEADWEHLSFLFVNNYAWDNETKEFLFKG